MTPVTRHGTLTGYKTHGCRCLPCRAASAEYQRNYKQFRRERKQQERDDLLRREGGQLLVELAALERVAVHRQYQEALGVLRMHMWALKLDMSLDALRRGER